jgi:hypothetical protein
MHRREKPSAKGTFQNKTGKQKLENANLLKKEVAI